MRRILGASLALKIRGDCPRDNIDNGLVRAHDLVRAVHDAAQEEPERGMRSLLTGLANCLPDSCFGEKYAE